MKTQPLVLAAILLAAGSLLAQAPNTAKPQAGAPTKPQAAAPAKPEAAPPPAPHPIEVADILAWRSLRGLSLSNDGHWLAYRISPNEGDSELVLRPVADGPEKRFPIGDAGFFSEITFSDDSKWLAFTTFPTVAEKKQPGPRREGKLILLELATGKTTEFERVRRFVFSPKGTGWLALHKSAGGDAPPALPPTMLPPGMMPPATPAAGGSDLILRELKSGVELNIGNVSEFAFNKAGHLLALVIDAAGQSGNGVQLRTLASNMQIVLDGDKANYRGLSWTEAGDGLAVLKGVDDKAYQNKRYSVVGFTDLAGKEPKKTVYDPHADTSFPAGMTISTNRTPTWTEDLSALVFGINELKKKEEPPAGKGGPKGPDAKPADKKPADKKATDEEEFAFQPPRRPTPPTPPQSTGSGAADKPDLVIWHWKDSRLQSQQATAAPGDANYNYLCVYRVAEKKFIRLADDTLKQVNLAPKQLWAIGLDNRAYELSASLDGRNYQDVYAINTKTGERKLLLKKQRWGFNVSPDGTHGLYYNDGQYYSLELATGRSFNLTQNAPTSFVDEEDDHNVAQPPTRVIGWCKDGKSVLISDNWDIWHFPVQGGSAINLTEIGKKEQVRCTNRFVLDREEKGIDLSGKMYIGLFGEWTKKAGIAVLEGGKPGCKRLLWDDAGFDSLLKAKEADVYLYSRQTFKDPPDYYAMDASLAKGRKLTSVGNQQDKVYWSKGVMLVNYTGTKGKKLQGALYLPANYEPGKRYPTIVYIYEKLSSGLNRYTPPTASGFNKSVYTSSGYAVLMPDITYELDDPGRSACWCVLPALEAAIATGVVDRERVGLQGHSWGGYQTAFLITQTDAFKAAVAGAPLTNLISMYSSIYWNVGIANQPIFESSQGRFTKPYWENLDAYTRNSPVYHAANVKTPLMLLHNDRDGAVDFNQGIEYFNTLRRLQKPVVMLQYKGENHGLARTGNQRDYMVRMREFFDHHLLGKPAPAWLKDGVPHLKHEEHIKERTAGP